ncbi:MAG: tetratricopeptide repeat protein [Candidatus Latescibacterota bacterium]|nr:tetratricopeptide repeat protein [Candidatus Latescibacterota bacterium]
MTVFSVAIFIVFIQKPKSISSNLTSSTTPIRKNAVNIDSLTIHAQKALNARQFLKALKISSTGLQNDSTSTNLLNIQATAYASQGRYALAIEALTKITGIQPNSAIAYLNLGGIYTKLGKFKQAEINLKQALKFSPDQPEIHRRLGEVFLGTKRYILAQEHFSTALRFLPQASTLHYYLGRTLEGASKNDSALTTYLRAVKIDIGFAECYYRAAILARKLGLSNIAKTNMERFTLLGEIGSGDTEAIKKFKKLRASILNAPESFMNHLNMGHFFGQHNYIEEAENQFQLAIGITSETPKILNHIGNIYLELKKPNSALPYYIRSAEIMPGHIPSILNIGVTYELIGDFKRAFSYYDVAIERAPLDARCWYALGLANFNKGDIKGAKAAWEKTLRLTPNNHPLRQEVHNRMTTLSDQG